VAQHQALARTKGFQEALIQWFEGEKEDYPWRRTTDPWAILVSEVMLQQTQVATVLGKGFYVRFLERFPDVESIADASEQEILRAWEGLGYYRRVRNLQKTAQAVVVQHGGEFPREHAELLDLPGVGKYTAGAVSSFAYHQAQPLVDANVARVFARLFNYRERVDSSAGQKQLWKWAGELLSHDDPAAYNSALMELGQKVCKNKNPQCMLCPVRDFCVAEEPEALPIKKEKKATVLVDEHALWVVNAKGDILLAQEPVKGRREGMWALPKVTESVVDGAEKLYQANYGITHHKVTLRVYLGEEAQLSCDLKKAWVTVKQLDDYPMPSPFRKAVDKLLG